MPIEVFPGQTGDRLIARDPVREEAYAHIYLVSELSMSYVTASYQGGSSNGYPVLSPVANSLPEDVSRTIEAERKALIDDSSRYLTDEYDREIHDLANDEIGRYRAIIPVFSSIRIGVPLQLILPYSFRTPRYELGVVHSWDIFNP